MWHITEKYILSFYRKTPKKIKYHTRIQQNNWNDIFIHFFIKINYKKIF